MDDTNPAREVLTRSIVTAAEHGDRLAFAAAAQRLGTLEEAQAIVRSRGIVRMVDRVALRAMPALAPELKLVENRDGEVSTDAANPTMFGHFAVFNEMTEIDSMFEGHFMERIAPGAFKKTMRENRSGILPLFQHGTDPVAGDKPLGPIDDLREDDTGAYYEVPLLDAPYVRQDILPGLQAGLYGASFRFQMVREQFDEEPDTSDENPHGLPERTLKEVRLFEFGPVSFPAYPSATAGVRNANGAGEESTDAPPEPDAAITAPRETSAAQAPRFRTREEWQAWLKA